MIDSKDLVRLQLALDAYSSETMPASFGVSPRVFYNLLDGRSSRENRVRLALILRKKPSEIWSENDKKSLIFDDALYFYSLENVQQNQIVVTVFSLPSLPLVNTENLTPQNSPF